MSAQPHFAPEMSTSESTTFAEATSDNLVTEMLDLESGLGFSRHSHPEDQLSWMRTGAMTLTVDGSTLWLRGPQLAWIPAHIPHAMTIVEGGQLISRYTTSALRPVGDRWTRSQVVAVDDLMGATLRHLGTPGLSPARQGLCHRLVVDLLNDSELGDLADQLGISEKTLSRAFRAGTGSTFRQWRTDLRLHTGAGLLVRGLSVNETARTVGYRTASSFITSFTHRFGMTPGRFTRTDAQNITVQ